jgi:hypothetical protein
MLPLVQISVVVTTLAIVAIAIATVHAMVRVERATDRFAVLTGEVRRWVVQANELTRESRETLASFRGVIAPVGQMVERFETLGLRTADLSAALLRDVETPLLTAAAVARVATDFLKRLSHRFTGGRSATNGGSTRE